MGDGILDEFRSAVVAGLADPHRSYGNKHKNPDPNCLRMQSRLESLENRKLMPLPQNVPSFDSAMVDVIRAVLAGNADRFVEIIGQYQSAVLTLVLVLLHDRQAALEVTQDGGC